MRNKKANGTGDTQPELQVHWHGDDGISEEKAALLDAAQSGPVYDGDQRIEALSVDSLEAAIMRPRDGVEMLYIGLPKPGRQPPCLWSPAARFDQRKLGDYTYIQARSIRTQLGAPTLAALEHAMGRDGLSAYNMDEQTQTAEPVKLQAAALVTLQSGSKVIRAKFRGAWFGAGIRMQKHEPPPNFERDVPGGEAYALHTGV